jgi:hypothetical protein
VWLIQYRRANVAEAQCAALRDALTALASKWDDAAVWEHDDMSNTQSAQTFDQCAADLRAALAQSQPERQERR